MSGEPREFLSGNRTNRIPSANILYCAALRRLCSENVVPIQSDVNWLELEVHF